MFQEAVRSIRACLLTFVLTAVVYPAVVWSLAHLAFPHQADGSLVYGEGRVVVGSELIAQPFAQPGYFHPRPSAVDYKANATGGSNLGTKNPALHDALAGRVQNLGATTDNPAPADLVTASGSGVDPHISPESARFQAARVAKARGWEISAILDLIEPHIERSGAVVGAPSRVNVLRLNLALDRARSKKETSR